MGIFSFLPEMIVGASLTWGWYRSHPWTSTKSESVVIPSLLPPVLSEQAELIVELLKSQDNWKEVTNRTMEHPSGVRVGVMRDYDGFGAGVEYVNISILDDNNVWVASSFTLAEQKCVIAEYKANKARTADRKQRELTKSLAKRILDPSVRPVLGEARLPPSGDDDSVGKSNSLPSGYLSYDHNTGTLISSVRGDNVKLELDAKLRERYGMRRDPLHQKLYLSKNGRIVHRED